MDQKVRAVLFTEKFGFSFYSPKELLKILLSNTLPNRKFYCILLMVSCLSGNPETRQTGIIFPSIQL